MTGQTNLLLFHVDGPSARDLTALVAGLFERRALHVQQMPAFAPGGEPRVTLLVEVQDDQEGVVSDYMARTHGIARYHRLASTHVYRPVTETSRPVIVVVGGQQIGHTVRFSVMGTEREPLHVRVYADDVRSVSNLVRERGGPAMDQDVLRQRLEGLFQRETGFVLELD